jgi:hypothetical protein
MMKKKQFLGLLFFYIVTVIYLASTTPITPHEAKNFYHSSNIVSWLMHTGNALFPYLIGLRFFFLGLAFLAVGLFYKLSLVHFQKSEDAYFATALFMFLPGILTATALANIGIIVLALVLLFVFLYERGYYSVLPFIMFALFFIHEASIIFFAALLFYGLVHKDTKLSILSSAFLIAFVYLAKGIEIGGRPSGHFIEIFGLYAAVFSPLLFLYFFYTMYRILLRGERTLMWYISFSALAFSLLLSIRQKVYITDFAPYVMISTLIMVDVFMQSLRVRLPQFRMVYLRGFYAVIALLVISSLSIIFNHQLFKLTQGHKKEFAHKIYRPYLMAQRLKKEGVECYDVNERIRFQLRYYGIPPCRTNKQ